MKLLNKFFRIQEYDASDITEAIIKPMTYAGCNPRGPSFLKVIGYINVGFSVAIAVLMAFNFVYFSHNTVTSLTDDSVMFFGFIQIAAKLYGAVSKKHILESMLDNISSNFWAIKHFDKKTKFQMVVMLNIAVGIAKLYKLIIIITITLLIGQAAIKENRSLLVDIWFIKKEILKTTPYYQIMFILQVSFLTFTVVFCLIPLDQLFIVMTSIVCIQFKLIRRKLVVVDSTPKSHAGIIRRCVIHHNIILKFLQNFEEVFSQLFLFAIGSNFILITTSMYGMVLEESLNRKLTSIFIYFSCFGQVFAYCLAGQLIQDEATNVGLDAYNNSWNDYNDTMVTTPIMMIIVRSQKKMEITAGGYMVLSMENFAVIARASFSFLAFLFNVRD